MAKAVDISGKTFGRLTVIRRVGTSKNGSAVWECKCSCGNIKEATTAHLKGGWVQSCGCLNRQRSSENCLKRTKHGCATHKEKSKFSRLYSVWRHMKDRCQRPENPAYENYGGRGIMVCSEWENDFGKFKKWAVENGYDVNAPYGQCTIDRIDNDKGYCPSNCRFITISEQAENRRISRDGNGKYKKSEVTTNGK